MNDDSRGTNDKRFKDALHAVPRAQPPVDLPARIIAQLPQKHAALQARWLGAVTAGAALLGLALAYQTAFDLYTRGAFDLVAYYTAQPAIVATYPREAFGALAQAIPWLTVGLSAGVLGIALILVYRLAADIRSGFWQHA